MLRKKKITWKDFEAHCKQIELTTPVDINETPAEKKKRIERAKNDYKFFFEYYFPKYAKAPTAKFHIQLANKIKADPLFKGIFEAFRGAAKSTHGNMGIPLWLMFNGQLKCMLLVGQTEKKAQRLLADIQAQLMGNQRIINDFGIQFNHGSWEEGEFKTKDGHTFYAIGMGQSPNGTRSGENRPDFITCDDLDNKALSKNPRLVREAVEWIQDELMGCFDIGTERFLFLNSRIAKCSILATLHEQMVKGKRKAERWFYLLVNALDKKGNSTWPEKYSNEYWRKKRLSMTLRSWLKNYMNTPIEEGTIFKMKWIKYKKMLSLHLYDYLVAYCDPSFKDSKHSDFKAIKLWGKVGRELHLIDAFVRQCSVSTMVKWFYDLHERIPEEVLCEYWMEANFLQDLLLDEFTEEGEVRGYQLAIRGDDRKKPDKFSRIEATSPLYERGFVFYNEDKKHDPDFETGTEQLLAIEQGSNAPDDSPDADEGAIHRLQRHGRKHNAIMRIGDREPPSKFW